MPLAIADSAETAADAYRERGLLVAAAAKSASGTSLFDADLSRPLFVLVGGEKRGVTRSFRNHADLLLGIPYGRDFGGSLGTVSATTLIAFEAMRQRQAANR
jgi:23S rRNA (guanosine2251-2'-O)-methyltransferase